MRQGSTGEKVGRQFPEPLVHPIRTRPGVIFVHASSRTLHDGVVGHTDVYI